MSSLLDEETDEETSIRAFLSQSEHQVLGRFTTMGGQFAHPQ